MSGKIARRGRALSVVMLCVAVIISFLPWSSGMSGYAFAGDTPETVEEAKAALDRAERLLGDISDELMVNLREWVNGEEISDVRTGDYSVRMVMEIRGDNQFLEALEALVLYSKDEKAGLREIWRTRK